MQPTDDTPREIPPESDATAQPAGESYPPPATSPTAEHFPAAPTYGANVVPAPLPPSASDTPPYYIPFTSGDQATTAQWQPAAPAAASQRGWGMALRAILLLAVLLTGVGIGAALLRGHSTAAATTSGTHTITTSSGAVNLPSTVQDLQQTVITVVHTVDPSVVEVNSAGRSGSAIGSGEFLTKDGYIVTNNHVVAGFASFSVKLSDGTSHAATLIGQDAQDDLAVLKTDVTNATPIAFADSSQVQIGEFVVAVGSPLGLEQSATFGIVSALNRTEQEDSSTSFTGQGGATLTGLIQTSAPINPGNSGGALVDLNGRLVGIPTLGATGTQGESVSGIGFAIPSNRVKTVATQLMQGGQVANSGQGFLGIEGQDAAAQNASQSGVTIQGFAADAHGANPAQAAGAQVGDIIVAVNGQTITNTADLASAILPLAPQTKVTLTILRNGSHMDLHVTLGERPTSQG
jgi:putative serine protease PepD